MWTRGTLIGTQMPTTGSGIISDTLWMNAARVRGYLWVFAVVNVATLLYLWGTSSGGVDRNGFLVGSDFLSFWAAGQMVAHGTDVYDTVAHITAQREFYTQGDSYVAFFYPPPFLLLCYPLSFLPYFWALACWIASTGTVYLTVISRWLTRYKITTSRWLLAAAFPPVLITITHGQTSFLVGALLGLGALLVRNRPGTAGVCFGLAVIKPQFGVLVPLVLLLTGEWRVIVSASATALSFGLAASAAFGLSIWAHWLKAAGAAQAALGDGTVGFGKMQSSFAAAMLLGAPVGIAQAIQVSVALAVICAICWVSWRKRYSLSLGAAMLAGAPLVTPFILDYDLVILAFPLIWLVGQGLGAREAIIAAATFTAATFSRPLALTVGLPVMPFVLAVFFGLLIRKTMGEKLSS